MTMDNIRDGESVLEWVNRNRARTHAAPVPERIPRAKKIIKTHALSAEAWDGLANLARKLGYVQGPKNNANITRFLEVLGQNLLDVRLPASDRVYEYSPTPSPDE